MKMPGGNFLPGIFRFGKMYTREREMVYHDNTLTMY